MKHKEFIQNIDVLSAIDALYFEIYLTLKKADINDPVIIGVQTGGVWVADLVSKKFGFEQPVSELNVSYYRDDFGKRGLHPSVKPSHIFQDINDKVVVLIDDVFMSGRTARASMNALFDYGRPKQILFYSLIDLQQPELPIRPSFSPIRLQLDPSKQVKLTGPEPLSLEVRDNTYD